MLVLTKCYETLAKICIFLYSQQVEYFIFHSFRHSLLFSVCLSLSLDLPLSLFSISITCYSLMNFIVSLSLSLPVTHSRSLLIYPFIHLSYLLQITVHTIIFSWVFFRRKETYLPQAISVLGRHCDPTQPLHIRWKQGNGCRRRSGKR